MDSLEDKVVFISLEVANRLGVRPAAILRKIDHNKTQRTGRKVGTVRGSTVRPFCFIR